MSDDGLAGTHDLLVGVTVDGKALLLLEGVESYWRCVSHGSFKFPEYVVEEVACRTLVEVVLVLRAATGSV